MDGSEIDSLIESNDDLVNELQEPDEKPAKERKSKLHECPNCGTEFTD